MSKEPINKPVGSFKYTGTLRVEEYRSKRPDAFPRFSAELGKTLVNGKNVWTNFKVYVQEPSIEHPLNIKIGIHNPSGKTFCQMSIEEFDNLLSGLESWRYEHNQDIKSLQAKDSKLDICRTILDFVESTVSTNPSSEVILNGHNVGLELEQHNLAVCIELIDRLAEADDPFQAVLIKSKISELSKKLTPDNLIKITKYAEELSL